MKGEKAMSKVTWRKESEEARKTRLDNAFRKLIGYTFIDIGGRDSGASRARYLNMNARTYINKVNEPDTVTIKELRHMVSTLKWSSEQVGEFLGCDK